MESRMMRQEIMEAVNAGEGALSSLYAAQEQLKSARNWGIFDMFGGGFFTDMIKHSKLDAASRNIEAAKHDLIIFQRELKDVYVNTDLKIEIGGFLSFADFFFDGIVADYMVQSKIAEARTQVERTIFRIEALLDDLKKMYKDC